MMMELYKYLSRVRGLNRTTGLLKKNGSRHGELYPMLMLAYYLARPLTHSIRDIHVLQDSLQLSSQL